MMLKLSSLAALWLCYSLLLSSTCCEALDVYVGNSSVPSITPITPHWRCANSSFDIANAKLCTQFDLYPGGYVKSGCTMPPQVCRGRIWLQTDAMSKVCGHRYRALECERIGCAGMIIMRASPSPPLGPWVALSFWWLPTYKLTTSLPVVELGTGHGDTDVAFMLQHLMNDSSSLRIHIRSGEPNEAKSIVHSFWFLGIVTATALHSTWNIFLASKKIAAATKGLAWKKVPATIPFVLFPEVIVNMVRILAAVSFASSAATGSSMYFPWPFVRILMSSSFTLSLVSTAAVSLILFSTYSKATRASPSSLKRARQCTYAFAGLTGLTVIAEICISIYAAVSGKVGGSATIMVLVFISIPGSISFIRYGGRLSRIMNRRDTNIKLSQAEMQRRRHFGNRVKFSGVAMLMNLLSLVLLIAIGRLSLRAWLIASMLTLITANFVSTAQVDSVAVDDKTSSCVRASHPHPHHTRNAEKQSSRGASSRTSAGVGMSKSNSQAPSTTTTVQPTMRFQSRSQTLKVSPSSAIPLQQQHQVSGVLDDETTTAF